MSVVQQRWRWSPADGPPPWAESALHHADAGLFGQYHVAVIGGDIGMLVAHHEADVREPTGRRPKEDVTVARRCREGHRLGAAGIGGPRRDVEGNGVACPDRLLQAPVDETDAVEMLFGPAVLSPNEAAFPRGSCAPRAEELEERLPLLLRKRGQTCEVNDEVSIGAGCRAATGDTAVAGVEPPSAQMQAIHPALGCEHRRRDRVRAGGRERHVAGLADYVLIAAWRLARCPGKEVGARCSLGERCIDCAAR